MAGGEHEAVAVGPVRIGGVEFQESREQHGGDVGHAHRQAGMAGFGLLHRIDRERADRVGHAAGSVDGRSCAIVPCGGDAETGSETAEAVLNRSWPRLSMRCAAEAPALTLGDAARPSFGCLRRVAGRRRFGLPNSGSLDSWSVACSAFSHRPARLSASPHSLARLEDAVERRARRRPCPWPATTSRSRRCRTTGARLASELDESFARAARLETANATSSRRLDQAIETIRPVLEPAAPAVRPPCPMSR